MKNIPYQRFPAGVAMDVSSHSFQDGTYTPPKVSCLMVTRGNIDLLKSAYRSFKLQTWPNKELVIVCDLPSPELKAMVETDAEVIYVEIPAGLSLGELRNLSISRSTGEFVCQWDDDDLYAPERISVSMGVLLESSVDAVFLSSWVVWWMERNLMCISPSRMWEGSMLARRSIVPIYPSLKKGEDSVITKWILQNHSVSAIDYPQLYCYRITGHNTWNDAHFESLFSAASKHFKPEEFNQVFALPCFASLEP